MVDPGNYTPHYNANLCHGLAARGHDVVLETSEYLFEQVPPLGGYRVENEFFRLVPRVKGLRRRSHARQAVKAALYPLEMARWSSRTGRALPDVVHVQWSLVPLLDIRLYRRLQRRGVRLIYTAHNVEPLPGSTWSSAGFRALYGLADGVIVHAEGARQYLVDELGVPPSRVHVVPMGGPGAYAGETPPQDEARRRLGLEPDVPYLLFFGLIKEHKGLGLLLEALALARRERPDLRLLVAGQPMPSWRRYADEIARLDLGESLDLFLSFVPTQRVSAFFGAADVVVLPYERIFQSGVVLAAYTFGRPVIATDVGGLPELVDEGVTGFLVPPGNPTALAAALVRAADDREHLAKMGAAAAGVAQGPHSWARIAARHEEIYELAVAT